MNSVYNQYTNMESNRKVSPTSPSQSHASEVTIINWCRDASLFIPLKGVEKNGLEIVI